jgi:hypothetical protein
MELNYFECKICKKCYKSYKSLWNHNKKYHNIIAPNCTKNAPNCTKIVPKCTKVDDISCNNCNKIFTRKSSLNRHLNNRCKQINKEKEKEKDINEIKKKLEELEKVVEKCNKKEIHKQINNGTINFTINNFGKNNIDYISDKFKNNVMKHMLFEDEFTKPIPKIVENISFNPNHKENNNVKITNMRSKIGYKYTENKWIAVEKDKLLNQLYKMGDDILDNFFIEKDYVPVNIKEGYDDFQSRKEQLKEFIKKEIEMIAFLYNKNDLD